MDIKKLLEEAIQQKFTADATIDRLVSVIKGNAEYIIFNKYKDVRLILDKKEYYLIGVKTYFDVYELEISKIRATLSFLRFSESKRCLRLRDYYSNGNKTFPNNHRTNTEYEEYKYELELDSVLDGKINLKIDNTKEKHEKKLAFEREAATQNDRSFKLMSKTIKDYEKNNK